MWPWKQPDGGVGYEDRDLAEALHSGDVKIEGDKSAVESFLGLFPYPSRLWGRFLPLRRLGTILLRHK